MFGFVNLGLAPQALCCHLLRRFLPDTWLRRLILPASQCYLFGVFTVTIFEYAELPEALNALTRYRYQVLLFSPVFGNVVTFAPTEPTCAKLAQLLP